jgi:ech hydrogenase subunit A
MAAFPWILILVPVVLGLGAFVVPGGPLRKGLVAFAAIITALTGLAMIPLGPFNISLDSQNWSWAASAIEAVVILSIFAISIRIRSPFIAVLALAQLGLAIAGDVMAHGRPAHSPAATFVIDPLTQILLLIISVIGSIIVVYAIGYMKHHEEHRKPGMASEGRFFLFLVGFLGVMNGLVMANDFKWLSIFWEATTICSFALIGHDGTPEARKNAKLALLINSFGGVAMIFASVLAQTDSISELAAARMLLPVALLCVAAMTKSAQMPFQSWLLGAMVAPTPVSALLHSATMVKAGSYLVLRLSPAMAGTRLSLLVALAGGFTFAAASALAISQDNAKRVLAYSTIANLGLIIVCAGIGTPLAYATGLMIMCFHAASKGLLFLCVGTVEQKIGSRSIDDMGQIMFRMPVTTVIMLIGMASMLMPPFGMLLGKWMAIEAAISSPLVLVLLIAGSAFTVLFWAKWIGRVHTVSYHERYERERLPGTMLLGMLLLGVIVMTAGLGAVFVLQYPLTAATHIMMSAPHSLYASVVTADAFKPLESVSSFAIWPVLACLLLALVATLLAIRRFGPANVRQPFLCGENIEGTDKTYNFRSLKDQSTTAWVTNYYFKDILTEPRITFWANLLACMVLFIMCGESVM